MECTSCLIGSFEARSARFCSLRSAACTEELTGSLGCPELCTDESAHAARHHRSSASSCSTTTLDRLSRSSATTRDFTMLAQGDTADVRLVIRFDTLPNTFRHPNATADSAITRVDSARIVRRHRHDDRAPDGPGDGRHVRRRHDGRRFAHRGARPAVPRRPPASARATFAVAEHPRHAAAADRAMRSCWRRRRPGRGCASGSASARRSRRSFASPDPCTRRGSPSACRPTRWCARTRSLLHVEDAGRRHRLAAVYAMYPHHRRRARCRSRPAACSRSAASAARAPICASTCRRSSSIRCRSIRASLLAARSCTSRVVASSSDTHDAARRIPSSPVRRSRTSCTIVAVRRLRAGRSGWTRCASCRSDAGLRSIELVNLVPRVARASARRTASAPSCSARRRKPRRPRSSTSCRPRARAALRPRLRLTYVPRRGFGLP